MTIALLTTILVYLVAIEIDDKRKQTSRQIDQLRKPVKSADSQWL